MQQSPSAETNVSWSQFPALHGTGRFMTLLTQARHLSLPWATSVQFKFCNTSYLNAEGDISQLTDRSVNYTAKHAANFINYRIQKTCSKLGEPCSMHNSQCVSSSHPLLFLPSRLHYANSHAFLLSRTCHISQVTIGDQSKSSGSSSSDNPPASCQSLWHIWDVPGSYISWRISRCGWQVTDPRPSLSFLHHNSSDMC